MVELGVVALAAMLIWSVLGTVSLTAEGQGTVMTGRQLAKLERSIDQTLTHYQEDTSELLYLYNKKTELYQLHYLTRVDLMKAKDDYVAAKEKMRGKRQSPSCIDPVEQPLSPPAAISFQGKIQLTDITLKKTHDHSFILQNISMTINSGNFIGLIGPSGAGKSSIFKLILGLETAYVDSISVSNQNVKNLDIYSLRKQFGVVLQSTSIFSGTIFSNIAANTNISLDEAWKLADTVGLGSVVN